MTQRRYNNVFLFLICLSSFLFVQAQEMPDKPDALDNYIIQLRQTTATTPLPFAGIKVIDARYDTTKAGYAFNKKLVLTNGLQQTVGSFLAAHYQNNFNQQSNTHLVIVIKTLWLHEISPSEKRGYKFNNSSLSGNMAFSEAVVKLESYIGENNTYQALFRIDTTLASERPMRKVADELLLAPFTLIINKIAAADIASLLLQRKKLNFEMIDRYNISRLNLPCFTTNTLPKGVYLSFADFINQKTSYPDFSIEEGKLTDELYIIKDNKKALFTDFWGFCDGTKNYIKLGFSFYPIHKQGYTYELFGSTQISHLFSRSQSPRGSSISSFLTDAALYGLANANNTSNFLKPLQINMENGTAY